MNRLFFKSSVFFSLLVLIFLFLLPGRSSIEVLNYQDQVFFKGGSDFFADFFNIQRYISENDPYYNEINGQSEKPYLPICYLIVKPFNYFCDYANMSLQDCWESKRAVFSAVMFLLVSLFFFFDSFFRLNSKGEWKFINSLLLLFSSVFLFTIERGNLIILTVACMNYFLAFYDSTKVWVRRLGLFCLCLAAVMKVYPAVLGILLVKDKKYNDILLCICCGIALCFFPFIFLEHGWGNIPRLIDNIRVNSEVYGLAIKYQFGIRALSLIFSNGIGLADQMVGYLLVCMKILTWLLAIISVVLAYLENRRWMQIALLSTVIMLFPTNSFFYTGMYLFPFIIIYMNKETCNTWNDYVIVFLICLIMNPVQIVVNCINFTTIFANVCSILLWAFLIFSSGFYIWNGQKSVR